ncbi:hypothetical protein IGB42_00715 [Andreprevotia sp. IGB-42]|uniref:O-antigen ligase family protein n=1 Tax=Andreprevotia sp. IGB-42 TaxID=2497473 RepID=UPI00135C5315|nr:O-antigen ligase family protein [Andreprevotia sp. IGB-42]KAF0814660.1 hypothetical protein IGB42_00715 [Andreprevotia sp. IGB-42]
MLYVFQCLLFLLAAVPCGIPYRYNPNPVFPSELAAFALSVLLVLAAAALPARKDQPRTAIPWSALIWAALVGVIALQCVALPITYWSERTVPALYFLAAGLSVWALARARELFGTDALVTAFAWGLLVGTLFNSGVGAGQVHDLIKYGDGRLVFGNIGQKNMYGHYLAWGMVAACWLLAKRKLASTELVVWSGFAIGLIGMACVLIGKFLVPGDLLTTGFALEGLAVGVLLLGLGAAHYPRITLLILLIWLALSIAWCGSRSPLMYMLAWLVMGWLWFFHGGQRQQKQRPAKLNALLERWLRREKRRLPAIRNLRCRLLASPRLANRYPYLRWYRRLGKWLSRSRWSAWGRQVWKAEERRLGFYLILTAALVFVSMLVVVPAVNDVIQHFTHTSNGVATGLDRLDSNGARRLVEWQKAWITFVDHPVLGVGWSAYAAQSILYQVRPEFAVIAESVLFTHAHNSLLNLMAETGLIGTFVVLLGLLWCTGGWWLPAANRRFFWPKLIVANVLLLVSGLFLLVGVWKRRRNAVAMLATALVAVSVLHSVVEYPLWYAHFLMPFALMLYLARDDASRWHWPVLPVRAAMGTAAVALLVIAGLGGHYYLKLYPILESTKDAKQNAINIDTLQRLRSNVFVDYYADFALSNYIVASRNDIPWKLGILDRLNSVRPYPSQLADAAVMHAMRGDKDLSHALMRRAAFAYPESLDYFYDVVDDYPQDAAVQALKPDIDEARALFRKAKVL